MIAETVKYEGKKRVLILGSSGQIGAYLTEYLKAKDYDVREFDVSILRDGSSMDPSETCFQGPILFRSMSEPHYAKAYLGKSYMHLGASRMRIGHAVGF